MHTHFLMVTQSSVKNPTSWKFPYINLLFIQRKTSGVPFQRQARNTIKSQLRCTVTAKWSLQFSSSGLLALDSVCKVIHWGQREDNGWGEFWLFDFSLPVSVVLVLLSQKTLKVYLYCATIQWGEGLTNRRQSLYYIALFWISLKHKPFFSWLKHGEVWINIEILELTAFFYLSVSQTVTTLFFVHDISVVVGGGEGRYSVHWQ